MTNEDRIKYYFGDFYQKKIEVTINEDLKKFKLNEPYFYRGPHDEEYRDNKQMCNCFWWNHQDFCINIPCLAISSDGFENKGFPAFSKARKIGVQNNAILLKLNIDRHWKILEKPLPDTSWSNKKEELIWRGNHTCGLHRKPNRKDLVENHYKSHNVRFWANMQNYKKESSEYQYYIQNFNLFDTKETSIEEHLKYKYIISMEGNDVATNLKWILASNSLALTPAPKMESWLMEGLLKPWIHYVPLNSELSNLNEILDWCKNNDKKCQEIVRNANDFMSKFLDKKNEKILFETILNLYHRNIKIKK